MFTPIDLQTWNRGQMFCYFSQMAPTGYFLTVQMDVTGLHGAVKEAGFRFFPAYLWLVTRNLNRQPEFKCALRDGQLGYYDTLTPLYATMHPEDHTISLMWTEFDEDFLVFHSRYLDNQQRFGSRHGVLCQPQLPPENAYTVSCLPCSYENKPYYFPSIEAGKFTEHNGRLKIPLSMTCHHATTDGYHVARFLEDLQADMDNFPQCAFQSPSAVR